MNSRLRVIFPVLSLLACAFAMPANADNVTFFHPYPKIDTNIWYLSDGWANGSYMACEWRADAISVRNKKLLLTLSDHGGKSRPYSCPEIHTKKLSGYGKYEARLRSAAGSGLNTAFFTYVGPGNDSPEHDEIDFEFLGKDSHSVQLNYYIAGKPQGEILIKLKYDAAKEFHNYSFVWEQDKITWYIDGKPVHVTKEGVPIPTNPGRVYLSLWSGTKEEDAWLGKFDYKEPANAEFAWVRYTPLP